MIKNFNLFNESVTNFEDIPWKYYTDYKIKIYSLRGVEISFYKENDKDTYAFMEFDYNNDYSRGRGDLTYEEIKREFDSFKEKYENSRKKHIVNSEVDPFGEEIWDE